MTATTTIMMMMKTCLALILFGAVSTSSFLVPQSSSSRFAVGVPLVQQLASSKSAECVPQRSFAVGTFVEFEEKKRTHIGKIDSVAHKSAGGQTARYHITDSEGKTWDIADKSVLYGMPCPNTPAQATKLFDEFCRMQDAPVDTLQDELEITCELLEMAWEEAAQDEGDHLVTSNSWIELIQGHAASTMEKYLAWKLLKTEMARVFFKEIKDHGRVVAFKAKTKKAVEAAKEAFCRSHADSDLCFV